MQGEKLRILQILLRNNKDYSTHKHLVCFWAKLIKTMILQHQTVLRKFGIHVSAAYMYIMKCVFTHVRTCVFIRHSYCNIRHHWIWSSSHGPSKLRQWYCNIKLYYKIWHICSIYTCTCTYMCVLWSVYTHTYMYIYQTDYCNIRQHRLLQQRWIWSSYMHTCLYICQTHGVLQHP